jgi:uncharacterized protein YchJ
MIQPDDVDTLYAQGGEDPAPRRTSDDPRAWRERYERYYAEHQSAESAREASVLLRQQAIDARTQPVSVPARPGRNDPCWCGSGKKYKKCHLPSDPRV